MVRMPQVKSKLVKLESETSGIAVQIRSERARNATFRQNELKRSRFAKSRKFAKSAKRDLVAVAALYRDWGIAIAVFCRDCGIATAAFFRNRGIAIAALCRNRTIAIAAFFRNCGIATAAFCRDRTIVIAAFCHNRGVAIAAFCRSRGIAIAAYCRRGSIAIAAWVRKLIDAATRGVSVSANARSMRPIPILKSPVPPKRRASENLGNVTAILVSACLGLLAVCAVVGVVILGQFRALKIDMTQKDHELATMKAKVSQLEKVARQIGNEQSEAVSNHSTPKAQLKQPLLVLVGADIQIIRQFIKVAPPQPGVQAKLSVGDNIAHLTASPIPMGLADAVPKLRGASFSIDQDGSIVIIGAESNRIDAAIPYR
jgi:GNAT superfamily N-acetyltransferase